MKLSPVESVKVIELGETDESISREERVFKFWLNSLGINVKNLSEDMQDGLVILNVAYLENFLLLLKINTKIYLDIG